MFMKSGRYLPVRWLIFISLTAMLMIILGFMVSRTSTPETELQSEPQPAENLLVWLANGSAIGPSTGGQIGLINQTGEFQPLMDVSAQASRIMPCGSNAVSPDGSHFAYFVGGHTGSLYLMADQSAPVILAENIDGFTCTGSSGFQFAPDGSHFAYITYRADARLREFADGFLSIVNNQALTSQLKVDHVVAFDMNKSGTAFVRFFTDDRNQADEAGVFWWDGAAEWEVAILKPDANCRYNSASVAIAPNDSLILVLGHRCRQGDTRSSWQIHSIDPQNQSAIMAASDFQPGTFAAYARTNNIYFSPEGETAYFTIPDGVVANTVSIAAVNLNDMVTSALIDRQAVMPTFGDSANAFPLLSPDGRRLALVVTSPNNENTLAVIDLANAGSSPLQYRVGSRGDLIPVMVFSRDSQHLYFLSGSGISQNADYALVSLDVVEGNTSSIKRGRFASVLVIAPSDGDLALIEYQVLENLRDRPYLNLISLDTATNETRTVLEGASLAGDRVTNRRFAYPLAWR